VAGVDCALCGATGRFWTFAGEYPEEVTLYGRTFHRAGFKGRNQAHVVAQYREDVAMKSLHLFILDDGTYRVDHQDDFNPDAAGQLLPHFFADYLPSRPGQLLGVVVLGALLALLLEK
jgi:hypothetical protein